MAGELVVTLARSTPFTPPHKSDDPHTTSTDVNGWHDPAAAGARLRDADPPLRTATLRNEVYRTRNCSGPPAGL